MSTAEPTATRATSSGEQFAQVGDVRLCYETFGDPANPAMLLIMGLGSQMILWREEFCAMLAERGFFVIRFDNRDAGRSTRIEVAKQPSLMRVLAGHREEAPYLLADMADDAAGLLDHLGIASAHVVGASLGGMVAQTLAVRHPERVLSLASIMSTTGDGSVGQPHPEGLESLLNRPPDDREGYVEHFLETRKAIGSPAYPRDEGVMRELGERYFERGSNPAGTLRQLVASIATGRPHGGSAAAGCLHTRDPRRGGPAYRCFGRPCDRGGSSWRRLLVIPGMGHDLPEQLWNQVLDAVVANTKRTTEG